MEYYSMYSSPGYKDYSLSLRLIGVVLSLTYIHIKGHRELIVPLLFFLSLHKNKNGAC